MRANATILFVDDAAIFRDLGSLFLTRSGRVLTAENGRDALAIARRDRPDVVVADLAMPVLSGDALCREIKADPELCGTPVILITPGSEAGDRARAVRAGADDVLSKPISRISLIQAVNRFLRFPEVRGLARVPIDLRVRIGHAESTAWGRARNLSRGGMFIEAEADLPALAEVRLEFQLPETEHAVAPTAKVVWRSDSRRFGRSGLGVQFLAVDPEGVETIESFVYERAASRPDPRIPGTLITVR